MKGIVGVACCVLFWLCGLSAEEKTLVGAIRWDAWYGDGQNVNGAVEATLSPRRWQWRAPFFAKVVDVDSIRIRGGAAEISKEIDYAAAAGINYWAFCMYGQEDNLSRGLALYLRAPNRHRIRFCMILQGAHLGNGGLEKASERLGLCVEYMKKPEYQTVLTQRPLIYLLYPDRLIGEGALGSIDQAVRVIESLRDRATRAGLKNPYIVIQHYSPRIAESYRQRLGADAIGAYAANTGRPRQAYADLVNYVENFLWPQYLKTGAQIVPFASAGFDMRPRIQTGVSWDPKLREMDSNIYHEQPTPDELSGHVASALLLLTRHRNRMPANTLLIYAWNEFDEGGWLCPTIGPDTSHLDAVAKVLKKRGGTLPDHGSR